MTPSNSILIGMLTLTLLLGCGGGGGDTPDLANVTGTVTIDGETKKNVKVTFAPVDGGRASTGITDENGSYKLVYSTTEMGAKVGSHTVKIASYDDTDPNDPNAPMIPPEVVPEDYLDVEKTIEVTGGSNTIDLAYP